MRVLGIPLPYRLLGDDRSYRLHDRHVSREILSRLGDYDIVHCWPLGSLETLRAARRVGVKSLIERQNAHTAFAYEAVAREHASLGLPVPKAHTHAFNAMRLAREQAEYALADKLLCPSDFVAATFASRGFSASTLARHQYGYAPDVFDSVNRQATGGQFTALFVGRCEPRKGLHYALQAWHDSGAARDGRFIICGSFIDGYRKYLRPLLHHPSVEDRGFLSDVKSVMHAADVVVLPSIEEGSALVTYEARGAGCVLLASDAAGAVGTHGVNVLVHEARDVACLSQHLRELSTDREKLERIRDRTVLSNGLLTWDHAARVLLEQYVRTSDTSKALSADVRLQSN
jgi:glycosyltransferase involved in cell wall biosynthesis